MKKLSQKQEQVAGIMEAEVASEGRAYGGCLHQSAKAEIKDRIDSALHDIDKALEIAFRKDLDCTDEGRKTISQLEMIRKRLKWFQCFK